jgi:purine nucleosidase
MAKTPLIIDCDPGKDDAVALLMAFASPEIELLAITTVAGNVGLDKTSRNALRICELGGRAHMAVHAGCPRPMLKPLGTAVRVHGEDGLAGAALADPVIALHPDHAVDFLVDSLMASAGDITIAALGPLTNLALAIIKQPEIIPRLRQIVLMGGACSGGNVTPHAEFNIFTDPHAAAVVFGAGAPLTMIGLDVTHQALATPARVAAIRAIERPAAAAVARMLTLDLERREGGAPLHDPCVIAYLLAPELFSGEAMAVTVETADGERLGQTVATAPGDINVIKQIDADGFFELLTTRLESL